MLASAINPKAHLRTAVRRVEDYWFDTTRSVRTSKWTELDGLHLAAERRDDFMYVPVRVKNARAALRALPVHDHRAYRFVDLGAGAGRALFVAAEYPFMSVHGVELAAELHESALANIRSFRSMRQRCNNIGSIHKSAADYVFPNDNLVVYMFNPFGERVMRDVMRHLDDSIANCPRDVILLMLYPELGYVADCSHQLELRHATSTHRIYRSRCGVTSRSETELLKPH